VGAVDSILQSQARADASYFLEHVAIQLTSEQRATLPATFLAAYRFQYLFSGLEMTRFPAILFDMVDAAQRGRIEAALALLSAADDQRSGSAQN
jgi:hypothetical protein